jgi:alpha-beta hydrolase superfamily lysophospholipase
LADVGTDAWQHHSVTFTAGTFTSPDDQTLLTTYAWDRVEKPRGVVQIAHGLAEHAARYDRLAQAFNTAGYLVHATDHRGHGKSISGVPGDFGTPGFDGLVADVAAYGANLSDSHPDLPLFLVAHSMGSFAAQVVMLDHSGQYAGVVLSGSTALDVFAAGLAEAPGPVGLEAFNAGFEHRTGYEWLSRDEAEVDLYVADPLCGFDLPEATVPSLFAPGPRLADPTALAGIRSDLPVLIVSGAADPLAGGGQLVELLGQRYRDAGLTDVTVTTYPDARHEIFNETNRAEVTADVVAWISAHTGTQ